MADLGLRRAADRGVSAPGNLTSFYVGAVVVLCGIGVIGVIGVMLVAPDDNATTIAAILGFLVPVTMALTAAAVREVKVGVDGRMTELLMVTSRASAAEAKIEAVKELALPNLETTKKAEP